MKTFLCFLGACSFMLSMPLCAEEESQTRSGNSLFLTGPKVEYEHEKCLDSVWIRRGFTQDELCESHPSRCPKQAGEEGFVRYCQAKKQSDCDSKGAWQNVSVSELCKLEGMNCSPQKTVLYCLEGRAELCDKNGTWQNIHEVLGLPADAEVGQVRSFYSVTNGKKTERYCASYNLP